MQLPEAFGEQGSAWEVERLAAICVAHAFLEQRSRLREGKVWVCFLAHDRPHVYGLSVWLGFGLGVPPEMLSPIHGMLTERGARVQMEMGNVGRHGMAPFLALSADGLEVPLESELVAEVLSEGGVTVVRRLFELRG